MPKIVQPLSWGEGASLPITEGQQSLTDTTTGDTSTLQHGYAPKLPNDSSKYLNGVGGWTVPAGGGGGGGVVVKTYSMSLSGAQGPNYTSGSGAPSSPTGQVGSIYYDSTNHNVYLKKSTGWGTAEVTGVNPLLSASAGTPSEISGSDGDYYIDTKAAVVWGPKASGTWVGTDVALGGWSMVALAGDTPTALEGSEGDWGWSDDGTNIRIYGPKSGTDGWPTEYSTVDNTFIDTGKISLINGYISTSYDEIRVMGAEGIYYTNGSSYTIASNNGYCLWRKKTIDTGLSLSAGHVLIGASSDPTTVTTSSGTPVVGGVVGTTTLALSTGGVSPQAGMNQVADTFTTQSVIQDLSAGGDIYLTLVDNAYGTLQSLENITALSSEIKFFFLPLA